MTSPESKPPQPPRAGPGATRDAWASYATAYELTVPEDAKRADIIDLCDENGLVSMETPASAVERGPSQATALRTLALSRYTFGCTEDGTPFAVLVDGPRVARSFRGGRTGLRAELAKEYARENNGSVPSQSSLADALTALEGEALEHDPTPVALRVAETGGTLLLDLGDVEGRTVQVGRAGWALLDRSPVLFRRTALTGVLPAPTPGGSLAPLRDRLNVADDDFPLVLGWILAALFPDLPHPMLALQGEQGTGKSTATRNISSVLDPSPVPTRSGPKDEESWSVAAAGSWVVGLDNLSRVEPWFSDALCRAVTGDGRVRRQLYTDGDLAVVAFRRVIIANGIDLGGMAADLADRTLSVELQPITERDRRREADSLLDTDDDRASVLGAVLDLAAKVLAALPDVRLDRMPRMADFSRILAALDTVTGSAALDRYAGQAATMAQTVADSSPFTIALRAFADSLDGEGDRPDYWTGSVSALRGMLAPPDSKPRDWPTTPQAAAAALKRSAPPLRQLGYTVAPTGTKDPVTRQALWTIEPPHSTTTTGGPRTSSETPSDPSEPSSGSLTRDNTPKDVPKDLAGDGQRSFGDLAARRISGSARGTSFGTSFGPRDPSELGKQGPTNVLKDPKEDPEPSSAEDQVVIHADHCGGCGRRLAEWHVRAGLDRHPQCAVEDGVA